MLSTFNCCGTLDLTETNLHAIEIFNGKVTHLTRLFFEMSFQVVEVQMRRRNYFGLIVPTTQSYSIYRDRPPSQNLL